MSENDVCHCRKVSVERPTIFSGGACSESTRETADVCEQDCDRLVDATEFERLGVVEHLFDYILRKEPAVVCARNFLTREALVGPGVFHCDRCLLFH